MSLSGGPPKCRYCGMYHFNYCREHVEALTQSDLLYLPADSKSSRLYECTVCGLPIRTHETHVGDDVGLGTGDWAKQRFAHTSCYDLREAKQRIEKLEAVLQWVIGETRTAGTDWGLPHVADRCKEVLGE